MIRMLKLACVILALAACSPAPAIAQPDAPILTPKPPPTPRINGAKVFGVRPGHPILYTIAATGERPMKFSATGLPDGARLASSAAIVLERDNSGAINKGLSTASCSI